MLAHKRIFANAEGGGFATNLAGIDDRLTSESRDDRRQTFR